jgi:hypothetical protein
VERLWRASVCAGVIGLTLALILLLQACSSGQVEPPLDVSGNWSGNMYPGCHSTTGINCYDRLITFNFVQQGSSLAGTYTCTRGNLGCLGEDHNGKIVGGRMDGIDLSDLRVAFPDSLNCLYQGQLSATAGSGEYMCFAGGMRIIEEGGWQLKRSGQ